MKNRYLLVGSLIIVILLILTAGCGAPAPGNVTVTQTSSPAAGPTGTSGATGTGPIGGSGSASTTIDLTAKNIAFDKKIITVPAGAQITVNFDNQDSGIPHNFAVYHDSSASQPIFQGETITGPVKTTYTFTAPNQPGTYYFRCDVHPTQMNGQFIVQAAGGGGATTPANMTSAATSPATTSTSATLAGGATSTTAATVTTSTATATTSAIPSVQMTSPAAGVAASGGGTTIDITAQNVAFDTSTITVPAGAQVTVTFNNRDNGVPHNVAFYTDSSASTPIYKGAIVTGPTTTTYTFTAPNSPGTYYFQCDVHPTQMNGQFIVQAAGGGGATASAAATVTSAATSAATSPTTPSTSATLAGGATSTPAATVTTTTSALSPAATSAVATGTPAPPTPAATLTPSATTTVSPTATTIQATVFLYLIAQNGRFDVNTITVPANAQVTIYFNNLDRNVAHNLAIYTDSSLKQAIFQGTIVEGPKEITYTFTAPDQPGTYYFQCDTHPAAMNGRFVVQ